jgi:dipeptidase
MSTKKILSIFTILTMLILLAVNPISAQQEVDSECTILGVTPGSSADGSAMTTHTDDSGTDTFHVNMVPAADHEPGSMRPVLQHTDYGPYAHLRSPIASPGEIPQVEHTYAYTNASYSFQNEMQVGMGESTVSGRREMRNADGWFDIVELQRIALERASTAREAIQVMGTLAEEYGYYIGGECIAVIDPDETWFFEIYGPGPLWKPGSERPGCVWAAQRIPDGEISVCANRSRIGEIDLDDTDNFMASPNIFSLAEEMGFWDKDSGEPFKVYETYGYKDYSTYNARREWRVLDLVAPSLELDPWMERYPFSVKPDEKVTPQDIMAINRDHYEGTEFDLTKGLAAGPFGTPNRYPTPSSQNPEGSAGWERAISLFRTNFSTVVVARKDMPSWVGGLTWFAYDAPHSSCYFPIYCGITELPESFTKGMRGGSYDVFSRESAWWAFNFVSNWADLKYSYMIEDIKAVRDPLEEEFFAVQPAIEKTALDLYEQDPEIARNFLTTYSNSCATRVVDAYWKLASQLVGRYADGYVYGDDEYKVDSVGYPQEWNDAVDFGKSTIPPEGCPK